MSAKDNQTSSVGSTTGLPLTKLARLLLSGGLKSNTNDILREVILTLSLVQILIQTVQGILSGLGF